MKEKKISFPQISGDTFLDKLKSLKSYNFKIGENRGEPVIQQTERNAIKKVLMESFYDFMSQNCGDFANVYITKDGIALELENKGIGDEVDDSNGFLTLNFNIVFKSLLYDAQIEEDDYRGN